MKHKVLGWMTALVLAALAEIGCSRAEEPAGANRATFAVHCYDVGAAALRDRPGVLKIDRGWQGLREVDRVIFDPTLVSVEQLEAWLKAAGTYRETLERPAHRPRQTGVP